MRISVVNVDQTMVVDGQVVPKPDPAVVSFLSLLNGLKNKQQIIFEAKTREMIERD